MKRIQAGIAIVFFVAVVLLCLPENLPIKVNFGSFKIDTVIQPFSIHTEILGQRIDRNFNTKLGLDLSGGSHLVFEADTRSLKSQDVSDAVIAARDIIERRVNLFGVSEPLVQTVRSGKSERITVDLPGVTEVDEAIKLIGRTAQLAFYEEATDDAQLATAPAYFRLTKRTGITGKHVKKATVQFDSQTGSPQVGLEFTQEGAGLFADATARNIGRTLGIFIDTFLLSAPQVQTIIPDGSAVITGSFSIDEAKKLAISINSGALPVPISLIEQKNIGPSLGAGEVRSSMIAGCIGLTMVLLFMILYYRQLGIIASIALLLYGMISFAMFRLIPVVLTLPGIAGFILSIGMAVDSNILIFERIKEEVRKGKKYDTAVQIGFGRAIDAIKDANITTILVGLILFNPLNWEFLPQFGMVRGFALTLIIGVITSLFTGVVITKRLLLFFKPKIKV